MWIKSKGWLGLNSHVDSASSTRKRRFGGTQLGWIGLRSVPITLALGNWSAKSIAHIPFGVGKVSKSAKFLTWASGTGRNFNTGAGPNVQYPLRFGGNWGSKET